ncbi:unnamed protein product [Camellia sinensis]
MKLTYRSAMAASVRIAIVGDVIMAKGKQVFEDPDSYGGEEVKSVIQKKHNKISMEALILLSDNEESHRYALGPAFMHEYTMRLQNYYPGMGGKFLFHDFALDWSKWHLSNPVENWPIPNENWTNWVDRVADAKGDLWKEIGIYDAIMLSKIRIEIDKHLFFNALFFWSVPTNSFHLHCGMMSPTILDIAALTGLHLHGEEVSAVFSTAKSPCSISYSKTMTAYDKFIDLSIDPNGVTEDEHVRFLVMWLNKFLFCNASHKITKDYTGLAISLAAGRKLALAPLVLSHLYRVLAEFLNRKFLNTDGPFWLLHLWLQAYFPEIGPIIVPWNDAPTCGFIYALSTPRPKTFEECFTFFYSECVSRTPIQYTPFSSRTRGPDWFLARPGLAPPEAWEEHTELWASYLIAREYTSTWLLLVRREKFTTIEEVEGISDQFKTLKKKFRMEAFLEAPQSSLYFDLLWTPYITKLKAEKIEDVLKRISPISIPPTASLKLGEGLITSNPRPAQIAGKKKRRSKPLLKDTISTKILKIKSVEINDDSHDLEKVVLPKELQPQKKSVKVPCTMIGIYKKIQRLFNYCSQIWCCILDVLFTASVPRCYNNTFSSLPGWALPGDFGNENVEVVRSIAELKVAKAVILGNHDAWSTQQFAESEEGPSPTTAGMLYGIHDMEGSAKRIYEAALGTPEGHLIIFLAHNGPTGLGSNVNDICGRDWVFGGGDHGDPDLARAISQLKETTKLSIPLVVFGHMHKELAYGNGLRKMIVVGADNTIYLNGAIVPRVKRLVADEQATNSKTLMNNETSVSTPNAIGTVRAFTLVEISDGKLKKIAEAWVSVVGDKTALEEEHILYSRGPGGTEISV